MPVFRRRVLPPSSGSLGPSLEASLTFYQSTCRRLCLGSLTPLVADVSPRRPGLDPRPVHGTLTGFLPGTSILTCQYHSTNSSMCYPFCILSVCETAWLLWTLIRALSCLFLRWTQNIRRKLHKKCHKKIHRSNWSLEAIKLVSYAITALLRANVRKPPIFFFVFTQI